MLVPWIYLDLKGASTLKLSVIKIHNLPLKKQFVMR